MIIAMVAMIALMVLYLAFLKWRRDRRRAKLLALGIEDIDKLTGCDFERLVTALFAMKGYKVEMTPYVGDWGADVVVSKNGERTVIQAKRWKRNVGVKAVQEVVAAKGKYKAQKTLVISNSTYTNPCITLARANEVELWDRHRLIKELEDLSAAQPTPVVSSAVQTEPDPLLKPETPPCPTCGSPIALRTTKRGDRTGSQFWGCSSYPKCRGTRPL